MSVLEILWRTIAITLFALPATLFLTLGILCTRAMLGREGTVRVLRDALDGDK